ncbi:MAG: hypothetical protein HQM11_21340, partial [SAR324 cluster bacterium]|nr:hypothetical protein [SAR324 cluster bacterium]
MKFKIALLSILIHGCCYLSAYSAIEFTDLDFWQREHLENQELRISSYSRSLSYQLDIQPWASDPWENKSDTPWVEGVLRQVETEYSASSQMPVVQNREGIWITKGSNLTASAKMGLVSRYLSLWLEPHYAWHENQSLTNHPEGASQPSTSGSFRYPREIESYTDVTLHTGYLVLNLSNWYLLAGKDALRFGSGKHDNLHLSNSAE